jgi:uncharacterized Fe-S cluster protein YjdI
MKGALMQEFRNDAVVVRYDEQVCSHSGECVKGLAAVFNVSQKPWINVNGADADAIARQIAKCPSGALSLERR